ncbi:MULTISPECIES: translesion error-prone DNA polymerase V autoproteolytic subunit [unclassified Methylophilus]|uniref:LexA family protein n=1 Tax=unclassified Methylophilus TaxID=2630143 RepID=UPI0023B31209|nr:MULTISPECIES: translesion error-prone DNA polymerase V autoproteolytic subunit [unclassified Methylophilus]MDF0378786.1 translesion error-prone DNA polymerase V autoproteolytic subunit [Methylophilus sp. YYY-1]MDT7848030.1 translesion error-prone DNA polymerase V autoproteolytic subunit [Methylophilus sp. VKM B-3414]
MNEMVDQKTGGKRPGAGRKPGSGLYQEATTGMRMPASQQAAIRQLLASYGRKQRQPSPDSLDSPQSFAQPARDTSGIALPLFQSKVAAGFPSPADDHIEQRLDPNEYLIDQADTTFFVTIQGESMIEVGLMPGDKAVVDKNKQAVMGDIVLAMIDGEFTIKTLSRQKNGKPQLLPANASGKYRPILIEDDMQFEIWGVVIGSFRRFR